ncbi:TIGR03915 family putative DNA repair protein [Pontibacter sp. BT310]|uniref:TIGR03915 family putative DNA repair protein n=1 Tax=Pontibacter populi TaxID=890055 RepID=A0ABS6XE33_9BACT|nr:MULTISPECIES: TIGR03915 family putative DNA repair protein [Pontibacter]MBJ6119383.1 TIGR03915 family putative DNA repair protein [Pontibacter sp. BT310]MBR0571811.1 TIGR03915 family putative DNA repair protein [Microvirga sp. STS03]MBW3366237.1 TIGR03915 family putative DNA repair protein [Pontibacter populi]
MHLYTYEGTFEGLLTVVFEAYERKAWPTAIEQEQVAQPGIFGTTIAVVTDEEKAQRVWKGLQHRLSATARKQLYYTYLWEQPGFELIIFNYIKLAFGTSENIEGNFTAPCVLQVQQAAKQLHREKHRMEAFVRFQKTTNELYYAHIEPDFNVLPVIIEHFTKRYADQRWAIYDTRRRYGAYYDLHSTTFVTLDAAPCKGMGVLPESAITQQEKTYQQLWQVYFDHVNIVERKNPKLHLRHVPKRYWKYLSEKQPRLQA